MWILLFIDFILLWLLGVNFLGEEDWRLSFITAMIVFQSVLVVLTEILSLFHWVTFWGLSIAWGVVGLVCGLMLFLRIKKNGKLMLPKFTFADRTPYWIIDGIIVLIFLITLVIALAAPPNTADSLVYHLPRMAYWAQEGAVVHFPASNEYFNSHPTGAESQMLHLYLLFRGDNLINLQGWFAFLGALIAAGALCKELGMDSTGIRFGSLFIATMPVAIAHASSTKNDLAVAFWVTAAVLMAFRFLNKNGKKIYSILLACAVGLAVLTKESAVVFLLPFGVWFAFRVVRKFFWRRFLSICLVVVVVGLLLNAGFLVRNYITYNHITNPTTMRHFRNEAFSIPILASNIIRNVSLHAQTPYPWTRAWIYERIVHFHDWLGVDPNDKLTTVEGNYEVPGFITSEVVSGNPAHTALLILSFLVLWGLSFWQNTPKNIVGLSLAAFLTFVLFSAVFKWQVFGSRYHFPIFFMAAPIPAYLAEQVDKQGWLTAILGIMLLGLASLWLVCLRPRPIIPWEGMTQDISIFENRTRLYYPSENSYRKFLEMGDVIQESGCREIGLHVRGSSMSYLYWLALGKPNEEYRIEYMVAGTPSAWYSDESFEPCAMICEDCPPEQAAFDALALYKDYGYFKLYLINEWLMLP